MILFFNLMKNDIMCTVHFLIILDSTFTAWDHTGGKSFEIHFLVVKAIT